MPTRSLIEQLRKVKEDQRKELLEIERREKELEERQAELYEMKREVLRGKMKTEQMLERLGYFGNFGEESK